VGMRQRAASSMSYKIMSAKIGDSEEPMGVPKICL